MELVMKEDELRILEAITEKLIEEKRQTRDFSEFYEIQECLRKIKKILAAYSVENRVTLSKEPILVLQDGSDVWVSKY